jgi:hypothetical protein
VTNLLGSLLSSASEPNSHQTLVAFCYQTKNNTFHQTASWEIQTEECGEIQQSFVISLHKWSKVTCTMWDPWLKNSNGGGFHSSTGAYPCQLSFHQCSTFICFTIIIWNWYNGPLSGLITVGLSLTPPQALIYFFFFKRHLQSFADLWPTLMGFSIHI